MASLSLKILNGEEIKSGLDLGLEGYDNVEIINNFLVVGSAVLDITADNVNDFGF